MRFEQQANQMISKNPRLEELKVVFEFVTDETINSPLRTREARDLISQMLLLVRKKGRPTQKEDSYEEAA